MPCNTLTIMRATLNAERLDLVAMAAGSAFGIPVPILRDGVLRFSARGADVTIRAGKIETRVNVGGNAEWIADSISKDLHLAYGRVTTRDLASRLGWRVEVDGDNPNLLTLVRE